MSIARALTKTCSFRVGAAPSPTEHVREAQRAARERESAVVRGRRRKGVDGERMWNSK